MANAVTDNLMSRLSPKWVEHFKSLKSHEHRVAWVRNYPIQSGEEEAIIQLLIDKLDPPTPSVTRVSQVRQEMQQDEAKGEKSLHRLDTVEGEAYWQDKLDVASKLDADDRLAETKRRHDEIKKLFPDLLPEEKEEQKIMAAPSIPSITVNPTTNEAKLDDGSTKAEPPKTAEPSGMDLLSVPGFGKDTVNKFIDKGITCKQQLFDLTYSQALLIAKTALVLAKIKDKFKSDK